MQVEEQFIQARRAKGPAAELADADLRTGLALSGGGIRSATFSLGVLQALSRAGLIPSFDYLSTVSGGSYIGSFFGALYVPPDQRSGAPAPPPQTDPAAETATAGEPDPAGAPDTVAEFARRPLQSAQGRKAVANLREFGRYLTPGGSSDTMYGISLVTRNWMSLQVVLGTIPLFFFLSIRLIDGSLETLLTKPRAGLMAWTDPRAWRLPASFDSLLQTLDLPPAHTASATFAVLTLIALLLSASTGIAYWFSRRESVPEGLPQRLGTNAPLLISVAVSAMIALWLARQPLANVVGWRSKTGCLLGFGNKGCDNVIPFAPLITGFVLAFSAVFYLWALASERSMQQRLEPGIAVTPGDEEENVRSRLTRRLATMMLITLVLGAATLVDLLGGELSRATVNINENASAVARQWYRAQTYGGLRLAWHFFWPFLALATPAALTVWAHGSLRRGAGPGWLTRPSGQAALGLSILFFWMVIWAAVARSLDDATLVGAWFVTLVWIAVVSLCYGFLNQSSLVSLYATRLKRAYVGASNTTGNDRGYDIGRNGDTIAMDTYYGTPTDASLALQRPVHLINVTIAQTQPEGASHVVAYDRKGKPMQVSPAGLIFESGGAGTSARMEPEEGEQLSLSTWTAISGAAASTAIGSITSLGLSILALMANVRLGYWWKANTQPWYRPVSLKDTVLGYLLSELQSSFSTDDNLQRWYLTDGGHFENTGAYALIQRRLDLIVVCDNGADPDYRLDDVVRLIDRARTDLNAEVRFLDGNELDTFLATDRKLRGCFGSYSEIATPPPVAEADRRGRAMPYAALARITYDIDDRSLARDFSAPDGKEPAQGLLMLIKPRLNFTEPPELLAYQRREAGAMFPQQTTLDQFFDEEQWEAYRRFGEIVGEHLFRESRSAWSPAAALRGTVPASEGQNA